MYYVYIHPMEVVKAFNNNSLHTEIIIKGSYEEPLFRANDIAEILEISNIRTTIQHFDKSEKVVHIMDTIGGSQQVTFLKNEANRTKNPEYIIQKERYKVILEKIHSNQNNISKPSVFYSPQFFRLSSENFEFEHIWGFFKSWNLGKDFVVLCNSNNPKIYKPLQTNKEYNMWLKSNIEYDKYVNSKNINPTYIEIPVDIEGVYIFKKKSNK